MSTDDGFLQAACLALAGLSLAGWLLLRRLDRLDLGRVTS